MYKLPDGNFIRKGVNETVAFCTSEYSDISPMSDAVVAFPTLDGRPSANEYNYRPELWVNFNAARLDKVLQWKMNCSIFLQEWVTATSIRITLNRLNTLGDEIWHSDPGLKSYFYAISDLNIGARFVNKEIRMRRGHKANVLRIGKQSIRFNELKREGKKVEKSGQ